MSNLMTGKVVVVTGGASGIGRATALAFAREGARVVIGDIDNAGAEKTVGSIRDNGGAASCVRVDVTKSADVQQMITAAVTQYGGLDYAFNNAGFVGSNAGIVETSEDDWHRIIATNLTGVWLCMKYEIPEMLKRGGGAIVNNGSAVGLVGAAGMVGNVASKHGVSGLTKSAALQYATQGIRVNAVAPGLVHTPMTDRIKALRPDAQAAILSVVPLGRWCEPEEVAEVVVFLCSDARMLPDTSCRSMVAGRRANRRGISIPAYLDAASAAVMEMGGKVAKKLGDGLMARRDMPALWC